MKTIKVPFKPKCYRCDNRPATEAAVERTNTWMVFFCEPCRKEATDINELMAWCKLEVEK